MGIKHFWIWFKKNFREDINTINLSSQSAGISVDTLAIDMNGIYHVCAQKVYKYGNYAPRFKKLLRKNSRSKQHVLFKAIAEEIDFYRRLVNPKKKLLLCVDGVAGKAKMAQQRQRRFRTAKDSSGMGFDPNCITPGTEFMDYLSKYLDWYIRCQISVDPSWKNLEVIFSNEKVPGEGEHKIVHYLREHKKIGESCCIHGMDADLIMLGLASPCDNIYILRDDSFNFRITHVVNLGEIRKKLAKRMSESSNIQSLKSRKHLKDFLLMYYSVGNDFLPHSPGIEILSGGIDSMIATYKDIEEEEGSFTRNYKGKLRFRKKSFITFLKDFAEMEQDLLNIKANKGNTFPDPVLIASTTTDENGRAHVDLTLYKSLYYEAKFKLTETGLTVKQICQEYIKGLAWVLDYYTSGIPTWTWCFQWYYAPFMSDVAEELKNYTCKNYLSDSPLLPFQQLMTVLPEKSSKLLPLPIANLMSSDSETLGEFFPEEFKIDLAGKKREWEGIALLPQVDTEKFLSEMDTVLSTIEPKILRRNVIGKTFKYTYSDKKRWVFKSYYGDIHENYCRREFLN